MNRFAVKELWLSIPALAAVDPNKFGLAVVLGDGNAFCLGDTEETFSIQSISKVFTLSMALRVVGDDLWSRVGREPSGSPFNSIVQLEAERGIPRNPLINAGAILVTDHLVEQLGSAQTVTDLLDRLRTLSEDESIEVDESVAESESLAGERNRALASFMKSYGNLKCPVEKTLSAYFAHCSIAMSCRRINAVMMSCGHYDNSAGTSAVGSVALETLVKATGWSVFV